MLFRKFFFLTAERAGLPVAASERSQPASLSPCADLRSWLGGVRGGFFGSQLRLSKVETFLHFRFAEFQVPLDTESRSYNRPNFRRLVDCIVGVIYYKTPRQKCKTRLAG